MTKHILVGAWTLPLWKIWVCQLGSLFPIYGKIKCSKPPTSIWWCANNCYRNIVVYWGKPTIEGPLCCVCSSISQLQIYPRMVPGYFSEKNPFSLVFFGSNLHFVAYPTVISSWYWWIQRQRYGGWNMGAPETHGEILKIQWLKEMNIPML